MGKVVLFLPCQSFVEVPWFCVANTHMAIAIATHVFSRMMYLSTVSLRLKPDMFPSWVGTWQV